MAYDSSKTRPERAAPSQSDADLTWTGIFLVAHKHYTFQVKVDVDACAPDELNFEANVSGGSCDVDAATVTTMVKRAKGACPSPPPAGFCNATNILVDNKVVYSCGVYTACTFHIQDTTAAVNTLAGCLEFCKDYPFAFSQTGLPSCGCQSLSKYETDGWISTNPPYDAHAIGGNP